MTAYRFYRESTGEWEEVPREMWRWQAQYTDGTSLAQFDDKTGIFHQFKEIQKDKLKAFIMESDNYPPFVLVWDPDWKLIHFYTNYCLNHGRADEKKFRVYCFGYEQKGHKVIFMLMPDGTTVITDDHNKIAVV